MNKKGIITVISGFSGAGKGTIVRELVEKYDYAISISATTRVPRDGEQDGVHYFFRTREEFEQMIRNDQLMEYAQYVDNYYGTPKDYVMRQLDKGIDVILEIEMQGALQVKERFPEVTLVFVTPPSAEELRRRLTTRGTETPEVIEKRLARAKEECAFMEKYDYIVVNDKLDECVEQIHQLIQSVHLAEEHQRELIGSICHDFENTGVM